MGIGARTHSQVFHNDNGNEELEESSKNEVSFFARARLKKHKDLLFRKFTCGKQE